MPTAAPRHRTPGWRKHETRAPDRRDSSHKRGYGSKWRRVRALFLKRLAIDQAWHHACCERCLVERVRERATDVHHRVARVDGGGDGFDNLEGLCHSCHSKETAKEGFG